jgi:hypothetical protein
MELVAQIEHHAEWCDLGREGRALFVFQCANGGDCETWSWRSGANACVVVEPDDRGAGITRAPSGVEGWPAACVVSWVAKDEGIDADAIEQGTKLGGVPCWVQSESDGPGEGWRFVLQIDDAHRLEGSEKRVQTANFGDSGIAYVFVRPQTKRAWLRTREVLEAVMLWQCG